MNVSELTGLTDFQVECATAVFEILKELELAFEAAREGLKQTFLVVEIAGREGRLNRIYVYDDEAGYFIGEDWYLWERQDYRNGRELMLAFLRALREKLA